MPLSDLDRADNWPSLPFQQWKDTCATLHMWTQIVGKVRMELTPLVNHWWNVPLYVSARGLTTSPIPYGSRPFELWFDFIDQQLMLEVSDGTRRMLPLIPRSVADFYREVLGMLDSAGIDVKIWPMPVEVPNPIRFDEDHVHASYDPDAAHTFWKILLPVESVFREFRSRFLGKCSPVHFFWGSFDLAVTRFSGRPAPPRPDADSITREAYSHEVSSVGFWPGSGNIEGPAFYSYAAPEPSGFREWPVRPAAAGYDSNLGEFLLMYEDVRRSPSPSATLLDFCQTTYEGAATLGKWDRSAMEREAKPAVHKPA